MDEIQAMKRVSDGNNPHVLKMLACVTTSFPMMLVLQFVPHGNLKDYLRAMKTMDGVRNNGIKCPTVATACTHSVPHKYVRDTSKMYVLCIINVVWRFYCH